MPLPRSVHTALNIGLLVLGLPLFGVGVPEHTVQGEVVTSDAQNAAAAAANEAARLVLRQRLPIATACQKFIDTMQEIMNVPGGLASIPGAKVGRFYFRGLPRRTFP